MLFAPSQTCCACDHLFTIALFTQSYVNHICLLFIWCIFNRKPLHTNAFQEVSQHSTTKLPMVGPIMLASMRLPTVGPLMWHQVTNSRTLYETRGHQWLDPFM